MLLRLSSGWMRTATSTFYKLLLGPGHHPEAVYLPGFFLILPGSVPRHILAHTQDCSHVHFLAGTPSESPHIPLFVFEQSKPLVSFFAAIV